MRVFRLENEDGLGPYNARAYDIAPVLEEHNTSKGLGEHRNGLEVDIPNHVTGWLCACDSLPRLRWWFWRCWKELEGAGFLVAEFLVDMEETMTGQYQLVFNPDRATLVRRATMRGVEGWIERYKDTPEGARRFVIAEIAGVAPTAVIKVTADPLVPHCWLAEWGGRSAVLYLDTNDFEEEDVR